MGWKKRQVSEKPKQDKGKRPPGCYKWGWSFGGCNAEIGCNCDYYPDTSVLG